MKRDQVQINIQINGKDVDPDQLAELVANSVENKVRKIIQESTLNVSIQGEGNQPIRTKLTFSTSTIITLIACFLLFVLFRIFS